MCRMRKLYALWTMKHGLIEKGGRIGGNNSFGYKHACLED